MKLSIIIPYRKGDQYREANFNFIKNHYETILPDAEIIIAEDPSGEELFCRAHSINNGVKQSNGDVLLISDGDILISKELVLKAVEMLDESPFVIPFGICYDVKEDLSLSEIEHYFQTNELRNHYYMIRDIREDKLAGGIQVITKDLFNKIGGYDERFIGWGYEDTVFCWKIAKEIGDYEIISEGEVFHLWHPRLEDWWKNKDLAERIKEDELS